jgi:hypothetical protein
MSHRLSALALGVALVLAPGVARASSSFPPAIRQYLNLMCPSDPACTICHKTLNGGYSTITTDFGHQMVMFGLSAQSTNGLRNALDQERSNNVDSDGDGDTDIAALIACRDPNQPDLGDGGSSGDGGPRRSSSAPNDPTPEYGCAIAHAPGGEGAGAAIAVGAALMWSGRRSRRPRKDGRRRRRLSLPPRYGCARR